MGIFSLVKFRSKRTHKHTSAQCYCCKRGHRTERKKNVSSERNGISYFQSFWQSFLCFYCWTFRKFHRCLLETDVCRAHGDDKRRITIIELVLCTGKKKKWNLRRKFKSLWNSNYIRMSKLKECSWMEKCFQVWIEWFLSLDHLSTEKTVPAETLSSPSYWLLCRNKWNILNGPIERAQRTKEREAYMSASVKLLLKTWLSGTRIISQNNNGRTAINAVRCSNSRILFALGKKTPLSLHSDCHGTWVSEAILICVRITKWVKYKWFC